MSHFADICTIMGPNYEIWSDNGIYWNIWKQIEFVVSLTLKRYGCNLSCVILDFMGICGKIAFNWMQPSGCIQLKAILPLMISQYWWSVNIDSYNGLVFADRYPANADPDLWHHIVSPGNNDLTHLPHRSPRHICVGELGHHWFR